MSERRLSTKDSIRNLFVACVKIIFPVDNIFDENFICGVCKKHFIVQCNIVEPSVRRLRTVDYMRIVFVIYVKAIVRLIM